MSDLIRRQDAIDAIENVPDYNDGMVWEALSHAQRDVALLPSAQPEVRTQMSSADLISRQDAIDVAKQHWYKPDIAKALEELPSAQPEIIRCENCAKRDDDEWEDIEKVYWCDIMDGCVDADDYCSYAERRDDGNDHMGPDRATH